MYRGERTYAEVVAEKGTRNGAGMPVGKWARAVVCEGKGEIRDWCEVGKAIARRVGMKGMVSVTPISAYKGCFFVENARKAQWFQERGSFTVRGEVFALRRWSPEENSVVRGKFRRGWLELRGLPFHLWDEVQLSHILQQWGRVTEVARNSLKFVDLSKVTLRVEMLPKVVLPALLEVEDGDWTYTVAVTVTGEDDGEDDGGDYIKSESSCSKDEMRSAGGCVLKKPQMVEGLRAIDRTSDCQRWMPRHRLHFSSSDSKSAKGEKGKGRWMSGPRTGSNVGPTPDAFEARSGWAQVGAKDFGPLVGPAHKGSSNGGPFVSSSSKLQGPGLSAKNRASEGLPQASSKTKGSPVSVRRRARSGPPRFDEASSSPKRTFEGGDSLVTNRDISRGKSHSRKSDLSTGLETSKVSTGKTEGEEGILQCKLINEVRNPISAASERDFPLSGAFESILIPETSVSLGHPFCVHSSSSYPLESSHAFQRGPVSISPVVSDNHRGGASCSKGVVVPLETSNQKSKDRPFLREIPSNLEVRGDSVEALFPVQEPSTLPLEGFQIEGLTPRKMVKVQSVLESLRVRIVRDNGKGVVGENRNPSLCGQGLFQKKEEKGFWNSRRGLVWVRVVLGCDCSNEDFKLEYKRKQSVKFGIGVKFNCSEKVLGSFSVTVKLNSDEEGSFWLSSVYGPNKAVWREDFWLELQDLHGLTFPRWCVGGDFNVIRRISEKMGDSRLTVNMRRFDEFIRESGLLDPPLRNAAFTWSNMQVDPICKRFENMWLLHPEFKEKFRDWWQEWPFSEEEVRMAVFQLNKEKAPGPDGFTLAVYQECWDVIKEDLMRVLSGRLRKVLHETIFGSQGAFVEGRQILDAVLIANEVVDEKRSFAILVNGNAKGWVKASRGLRQGDPLSPFLFTLVADVLSRLMIRAEEAGITEGFLVGRDRTRVSLLQFADDTIFFSKASLDLLQNLKIILLVFGQVSGLKINLEKSTISGINTRQEMLSSLALVLECRVSEWPLSYLGLPLGGNPKTIGFWDPVVERILRRLDGWKRPICLGGRITLIQSCLSHIPSYFLSLFKIPVSIASKIEKMQRDFLWSGAGEGKRDHLIRWEVVSRPREMGGLGFGKTSMRNSALLGKWLWRFPRERSGLWHKVIASIYGTHPNGWDANMVVRWSHRCPWKAIAQSYFCEKPYCLKCPWQSFPLSWNFNFRRNLTDSEIDLLQRLMSSLHSVLLSPSSSDSRAWSLSSSGSFSVKSFFYALSKDSNPLMFLPAKFLWSSKVPSKVKALAWLVAHGKVNTNDKLQLRRPYKALCPQWCILCKGNGESIDHFFFIVPSPLDFGTGCSI
ncbi:putative ribonuclease H protein [Vitis vinifera]|uniref:Putative ribonuclease H protein n=1 Tax=Vitis vinifera TaxID=29760 RepID=A0A438E2D1_VITVI|nr:putative ribonuclease H protein [Vitis vinifera]